MSKRKPKLLPIRIYGDKVLRQIAKPVEKIDNEILDFAADLTHTMYEKDGLGLAAPQVGVSLRMFVVDPFWGGEENRKKKPYVIINPRFISFEGEVEKEEGCLSIPEIFEKVKRAEKVVMEAMNLKGEVLRYKASDLFARVLQHEYDHLEGILFVDKISKIRKLMISKKLKQLESGTDENGVNIQKSENTDEN